MATTINKKQDFKNITFSQYLEQLHKEFKLQMKEMAEKFAKKYGLKMQILDTTDDIIYGTQYKIKLSRKGKNSIFELKFNKKPTMYDVLANLEKFGYDSFEHFCGIYRYDKNDRFGGAYIRYKRIMKEYDSVKNLFKDVWNKEKFMEEFRAIY